jgi:galactokinase
VRNRNQLLDRLRDAYPNVGDRLDEAVLVRAPGRVNLIGEHTDYNAGLVLPAAIGLETWICLMPTADRRVEIEPTETGERDSVELDAVGPPRRRWIDYVSGVAKALTDARLPIGGFVGVLESDLPRSAGLSSSAALELASAWGLLAGPGLEAAIGGSEMGDCLALAQLCQKAENEYVGVASGLMDQFASSCGVAGHALLLDCRSLEHRAIRIPENIAVVVVDTGSRRRLAASEYNVRRTECEHGVAILVARGEPVRTLRDATLAMLDRHADALGARVYARCRHVVEENARVTHTVEALQGTDRGALGELFAASHASLRDLYEVSSTELDAAVEIASSVPGVIAARMTGAGFGGCTVNLVERDAVARLRKTIEARYAPATGLQATVIEVPLVGGAGIIDHPVASTV